MAKQGGWRRLGRRRFRWVGAHGRGPPADDTGAKRVLASVMRAVGDDELGSTAAFARDSHGSPLVVEAYRAGRTLSDFRSERRLRPLPLTVDERALVRLLHAESRLRPCGLAAAHCG